MLLRLLWLISGAQGIATIREMAQGLDVSDGLLRQMIDQAVQLGYLAPLQPDCSRAPCHICRQRAACLMGGSARLWSVTDRGRRLLAERSALETPETQAG